jgi:hypothetical protein
MSAREIITEWLKAHGYDGLFSDGECACDTSDLIPCDGSCAECQPGYKSQCSPNSEDMCEACGNGGWHIQAEKPKETADAQG